MSSVHVFFKPGNLHFLRFQTGMHFSEIFSNYLRDIEWNKKNAFKISNLYYSLYGFRLEGQNRVFPADLTTT